MTQGPLDRLAAHYGLGDAYHDYRGELKFFSPATKRALLASMGLATDEAALDEALRAGAAAAATAALPSVLVVRTGEASSLTIPAAVLAGTKSHEWVLHTESGETLTGSIPADALPREPSEDAKWQLPSFPIGCHRLALQANGTSLGEMRLIVAPPRCYQPPALADGRRLWGLSLQLYTLRSESNWGIGDFGDLAELVELVAPLGCSLIGLNPLHALFPAEPAHCSPYSPSSRQFLNVLYICVPGVAEFTQLPAVAAFVAGAPFQARLAELCAAPNVDYARVAQLKLPVLRRLYDQFRSAHLAAATSRAAQFQDFVRDGGEALRLHAVFDALHAYLRAQSPQYDGWPSWPEQYRDPGSAAVQRFIDEHAAEVEFHLYLQWLAASQLAEVQRLARQRGMRIGLYGDVAVGVNGGGSETWANPGLYVTGAAIGAPPDPLALKGQDWGIPPQNPARLEALAYQPFVDLLRFNMRHVGALRLDHVMALFRQWWVPRGMSATEGAYVHYPLEDLMGLLALESTRHHCLVIGEDLGTVPDAVREAMHRYAVAHYKVLLFEKETDGRFKSPAAYEPHSLAAVTTHDLPTFRGWWDGVDIEIATRLDLYPDAATRDRLLAERGRDRRHLMQALVAAGLWYWQEHEPLPPASHALMRATHLYLGLSSAALAVVQIEDLAGMVDPVNVPGTHEEYPNWRRKVTLPAREIFATEGVREMLRALGIARTGRNPN